MHTPFDSRLLAPLYGTDAMRACWSDEAIVQSWLDVEIALARAQAELDVIPAEAAAAIEAAARLEHLDWDALATATKRVGMPIKPLLDQIGAYGGDLVRRTLHWGATTQDVLDTGQALRIAASIAILDRELRGLLSQLVDLADAHRGTVMVARTNAQDALPTTFGLHASGWATELCRHVQRLAALRERACFGMYGGAVGTLASAGPDALAVRDRMLAHLGLTVPPGAWNASQDGVAELLLWSGLVHGTLGRLANDVETMGRTATSELREGEGGGGSSTMPHKSNPRACNAIQGFTRTGTQLAGGAFALMDQRDVRAASMRAISWTVVPEAMLTLSASLARARGLVGHLIVDPGRMRASFAHSRGFVMSEAVMMRLADAIGREPAYTLVKEALARYDDGRADLADVLLQSEAIRAHLTADEVRAACRPETYLGHADALLDEALAACRAVLDDG